MNTCQSFRYKKLLLLFAVTGLVLSFSNCSKTTKDEGTIVSTAWKYETEDVVIELRFNDAQTCLISSGRKNAYSVSMREYYYERGYGIDLFFFEKTDDEERKTIFTGQFKEQNELTLFFVEGNVVSHEYATFKKIK